MENKSKFDPFLIQLETERKKESIPQRWLDALQFFYTAYTAVTEEGTPPADLLFLSFLEQVVSEYQHPIPFAPFHEKVRHPFDYYQFGLNFIEPLLIKEYSTLPETKVLEEITGYLERKENVIFLANHQTEADPQILASLLKTCAPSLAESLIFVAGTRVTTDPLAIPFSRGTNLLCIHSKRYIDHPPELKAEKQRYNQKTMELMRHLLGEGGKAIYVAPSGGRDRKGDNGEFEVAPFDPASIEMFYLMAKRAKCPTHFYPMALKTYPILPPPKTIQVELGEERLVGRSAVHVNIGNEIAMEESRGSPGNDKHMQRILRAEKIHRSVVKAYSQFPKA